MKQNVRRILLLPLFIGTLTLGGCKFSGAKVKLLTNSTLKTVRSKRTLDKILKDSAKLNYSNYIFNSDFTGTVPESGSTDTTTSERDFVGTNLQDDAVDEADIIKTNGDDIYYLSQGTNKFTVFSVLDTHEVIKKHEIVEKDIQFKEMYLLDDYAVALGIKSTNTYYDGSYWMPYYYENSALLVYDILTMEKVYELEVNYNIITTRLIDRALYIVGDKYLYSQGDNALPTHSENNGTDEVMSYKDIYYFDETLVYGMTLIGGIYLDEDATKIEYNVDGYLGAAHTNKKVYVNENNLYISDSNYYYGRNKAYTSMTVSQFALANETASTEFVAAATLRGAALNQFAMDEHNGYLRVATTDTESSWVRNIANEIIWSMYQSQVNNYLYILKLNEETKTFKLVSYITEGLGKPNETIRSVRFDGEKAYIVTFFQTDPLYVIDLSNPEKPIITDAIMLPGFDTYQHPWAENALIGIGYDATENGAVTGSKISAYDTTSGSARELQTLRLSIVFNGKEESHSVSSEGLSNHKALLVSPRHNIIGLPVFDYVPTDVMKWTWGYHFEYIVYAIDFSAEKPISVLTRIIHEESSDEYNPIRRAILIENHIYTFSNNKVVTYDITNNEIKENILTF